MLELVLFWMLVAGIVIGGLGHFWLLLRAFGVSMGWGLFVLFVPPASLLFLFAHWPKARKPFAVVGLGAALMAAPYGVNAYFEHFVDLGPREKIVDGELHITLTGWDQSDYSLLKYRPKTRVLQMANADVSDATLEYLKSMPRLEELDLNDTQITDEGLKLLATFPELAILRLRGTKITEDGFRSHLLDKESLRELDLRKTPVSRPTVKEWREKQEGRKALR